MKLRAAQELALDMRYNPGKYRLGGNYKFYKVGPHWMYTDHNTSMEELQAKYKYKIEGFFDCDELHARDDY